jgi:hypothetical protein
MESYYSAWEMADMHFVYGCATGNSQEARRLYAEHYPQHRIPAHKLFTSNWANLGPLPHRCQIVGGLYQFELSIWKFAHWEQWKKIPEPMCKALQLLKSSVFPLSGEFFTDSHFSHTTSSKCTPSRLLTIVQEWCFASGFSQNACKHILCT